MPVHSFEIDVKGNTIIQHAIARRAEHDKDLASQVIQLMSTKKWQDLDRDERVLCVRYAVMQSESEENLRKKLCEEFGVTASLIVWQIPQDEDAQALARALGAMISKSGAMVNVEIIDDFF